MATRVVNPAPTCARHGTAARHGTELHAALAPPSPRPQQRAEALPSAHREEPAGITAVPGGCLGMAVLPARRPEIARPQTSRTNTFKAAPEPAGIPPCDVQGCRRQNPSQKECIQACSAGLTLVPKAG